MAESLRQAELKQTEDRAGRMYLSCRRGLLVGEEPVPVVGEVVQL